MPKQAVSLFDQVEVTLGHSLFLSGKSRNNIRLYIIAVLDQQSGYRCENCITGYKANTKQTDLVYALLHQLQIIVTLHNDDMSSLLF